jgi:hypothetical protein
VRDSRELDRGSCSHSQNPLTLPTHRNHQGTHCSAGPGKAKDSPRVFDNTHRPPSMRGARRTRTSCRGANCCSCCCWYSRSCRCCSCCNRSWWWWCCCCCCCCWRCWCCCCATPRPSACSGTTLPIPASAVSSAKNCGRPEGCTLAARSARAVGTRASCHPGGGTKCSRSTPGVDAGRARLGTGRTRSGRVRGAPLPLPLPLPLPTPAASARVLSRAVGAGEGGGHHKQPEGYDPT